MTYRAWNSKQVIPVCLSPSSRIYHTRITSSGLYRELLAYGSGKAVVILSGELEVVQIIQSFAEVSDIAWSEPDGQLAVAVASCIVIYQQTFNKNQTCFWKEMYKLENNFDVRALCWTIDQGFVIAGGTSLVLWELYPSQSPKPIKYPETPLPAPNVIKEVSVSPDNRFFVSFCDNDRTPKVWYKHKKGFGNFYLSHPRTVRAVLWRRQCGGLSDWRNVIMTTCDDGEVRFWVESHYSERLQFTLMQTISTETDTIVDWLSGFNGKQVRPIYDITKDNTEFHSIFTEKEKYNSNFNKETNPHHDWIIGIEPTGSVILWRIHGISGPKLVITKQSHLKHVLTASKHRALRGVVQRFYVKEQDVYPSHISVFVSTVRGDVSAWYFQMGEGNDGYVGPKLRYRSCGHRYTISNLSRHSHLPLMASLDKSGNIIVWRISDTTLSDSGQVLLDLCSIGCETSEYFFPKISETNFVIDGEKKKIFPEGFTKMVWDGSHPVLYALHPEKGIIPILIPYKPVTGSGFETHVVHLNVTPHVLAKEPFPDSISGSVGTLLVLPNVYFRPNPTKSLTETEFQTGNDTSFIVGIDPGGLTIRVWRVTKDLNGRTTESIIVASEKIDPESAVTYATVPVALHHDEGLSLLGTHCSLITGGRDGRVRLWQLTEEGTGGGPEETWKLKQFCFFPKKKTVENNIPVISIAASHFGRIATFSIGQKNDCIKIWEFSSSTGQFRLEDVIWLTSDTGLRDSNNSKIGLLSPLLSGGKLGRTNVGDDEKTRSIKNEKGPLSMDWIVLTEGIELLALTRGHRCSIYTQKQHSYAFLQNRSEWTETITNTIPLPSPARCSLWVHRGSFVVAAKNHLYVFTKWIQSQPRVFTPDPTLFLEVSSQQKPHPFYHPIVLFELLQCGQFNRLGLILQHLHTELVKFKSTTENLKKSKKEKNKTSQDDVKLTQPPYVPSMSINTLLQDMLTTINQEIEQEKKHIPPRNTKK